MICIQAGIHSGLGVVTDLSSWTTFLACIVEVRPEQDYLDHVTERGDRNVIRIDFYFNTKFDLAVGKLFHVNGRDAAPGS